MRKRVTDKSIQRTLQKHAQALQDDLPADWQYSISLFQLEPNKEHSDQLYTATSVNEPDLFKVFSRTIKNKSNYYATNLFDAHIKKQKA